MEAPALRLFTAGDRLYLNEAHVDELDHSASQPWNVRDTFTPIQPRFPLHQQLDETSPFSGREQDTLLLRR
jgi:hypothetical protein